MTSGIANVATGKQGTENEISIIDKLSKSRNISGDDVLPSSTGIIGVQLPIESVLESMDEIIASLNELETEADGMLAGIVGGNING